METKNYTMPEILAGQKLGKVYRLANVTVGPVTEIPGGQYQADMLRDGSRVTATLTGWADTVVTCVEMDGVSPQFKVGDKVYLAHPTQSDLTYGYVREVHADETMSVYFPEIQSEGSGWLARDFEVQP